MAVNEYQVTAELENEFFITQELIGDIDINHILDINVINLIDPNMPQAQLSKSYIAGEDIHSGDLVILSGNQLFNYNHTDESNYDFALGIASQAGLLGDPIIVVIRGECYIPGWNLITDTLYYASSPSGKISETVPITGLLTPVGRSLSSDTLLVDIDESIIL